LKSIRTKKKGIKKNTCHPLRKAHLNETTQSLTLGRKGIEAGNYFKEYAGRQNWL
jgi:hypothetical protein